jgi:hypothetical protein
MAPMLAQFFVDRVLCRSGMPSTSIISYRDPWFIGKFWRSLLCVFGHWACIGYCLSTWNCCVALRCVALRVNGALRALHCVALCCVACKWSVALQFLNGSMGCSLHSEKQSLTCPPRSRDRKLMQFWKGRVHSYQVGDQVLLATRENQLPPGHSSIFSAKSYGPFSIVADVGRQAFRLDLPNTVYIHLVLHVSHLKPYVFHL